MLRSIYLNKLCLQSTFAVNELSISLLAYLEAVDDKKKAVSTILLEGWGKLVQSSLMLGIEGTIANS